MRVQPSQTLRRECFLSRLVQLPLLLNLLLNEVFHLSQSAGVGQSKLFQVFELVELKVGQLVLVEIISLHALVLQFHEIVDLFVLGGGLVHGVQLPGEVLFTLLV